VENVIKGIAIDRIKFLALCAIVCGILSFVVGSLLGGMDGDTPGIYFGQLGLILIATGIAALIVWFIALVRSR
jgi:hypothetical protein